MTLARRDRRHGAAHVDPAARVTVRAPSAADRTAFLAATRRSRELHRPWAFPPTDDAAFDGYLRRYEGGLDAAATASHIGFVVEVGEPSGTALAGVVNANDITRGNLASAALGYYAFVPYAGTGAMRAGIALALDELFGGALLHRVEANIQPGNAPSIALIRGLGFRREGFSPAYLRIDGQWRDHERWALLAEEWRGQRPRGRSSRARSA